MSLLLKLIQSILQTIFFNSAMKSLKKQKALLYLKSLQAARKGIIFAVIVFCLLQSIVLGLFGTMITLIFLYPEDDHLKILVMLGFLLVMFLFPLFVLIYLLSDRRWYKISGAEKILNDSAVED
jgi:hypothetical protein